MLDPTKRFSSRVDDYVKWRPHYPDEVLDILREEVGLTPEWVIADVGAGTGFLTELFLGNGNRVFAIEPNAEMRGAAEERLAGEPGYTSIDARAEATTLPDASIDMVTAGQAFHWFDIPATREEFRRILKPGGWVALIDNRHAEEEGGLHDAIEALLAEHSAEHRERREEWGKDHGDAAAFFGEAGFVRRTCANRQVLGLEGMIGRVMSRSTTPEQGRPGYEEVLAGLKRLFDEYRDEDGTIVFEYETQLRLGRLDHCWKL